MDISNAGLMIFFAALSSIGAICAAAATWYAVFIAKRAMTTWRDEHIAKHKWHMIQQGMKAIYRINSAIDRMRVDDICIDHWIQGQKISNFFNNSNYGSGDILNDSVRKETWATHLKAFEDAFNDYKETVVVMSVTHDFAINNKLEGLVRQCENYRIAFYFYIANNGRTDISWGEKGERYRQLVFLETDPNMSFMAKLNFAIEEATNYLRDELRHSMSDHAGTEPGY